MKAGKLRHRVALERQGQAVQDPQTGDLMSGWVHLKMVWASVEALSGREFIAAQAAQSEVTARVTMRKTDVRVTDRLVYQDAIYDIHAVLPDPKSGREYLNLMVSKGANNG